MPTGLSPHIEQMIQLAIASGRYPSRDAVLEAGVESLMHDDSAEVPPEHVELLERSLDQLDAGLGVEWNVEEEIRLFHERRAARQQSKAP